MSDDISSETTSYQIKISKEAMGNMQLFKRFSEKESINEMLDWMFLNVEEGGRKLSTLEKIKEQFDKA